MPTKNNIFELAGLLKEPYRHLELGTVDDHAVYVILVKGEFPMHHHTRDEMYVVVKGEIRIRFRNIPDLVLHEGESTVVRAYTTHSPDSDQESVVLLIKPKEMFATQMDMD